MCLSRQDSGSCCCGRSSPPPRFSVSAWRSGSRCWRRCQTPRLGRPSCQPPISSSATPRWWLQRSWSWLRIRSLPPGTPSGCTACCRILSSMLWRSAPVEAAKPRLRRRGSCQGEPRPGRCRQSCLGSWRPRDASRVRQGRTPTTPMLSAAACVPPGHSRPGWSASAPCAGRGPSPPPGGPPSASTATPVPSPAVWGPPHASSAPRG
mmetsp:Transcript_39285/g.111241  ORF Transcript_39285/g.111241 Transcript_39285/m.111241 type:complete len:207 (+) Transcript_39285:420-1040(+)